MIDWCRPQSLWKYWIKTKIVILDYDSPEWGFYWSKVGILFVSIYILVILSYCATQLRLPNLLYGQPIRRTWLFKGQPAKSPKTFILLYSYIYISLITLIKFITPYHIQYPNWYMKTDFQFCSKQRSFEIVRGQGSGN